MGLREYLLNAVKSRAEGEVRFDGEGRSNYYPPGARARAVGDLLAGLGTLGFTIPLLTPRLGSPARPSGAGAGLYLVLWTVLPFVGALIVWYCIVNPGWERRVIVLAVGLVGTGLTWQWGAEVIAFWAFGGPPPPGFELAWLGQGSLLVLVGGFVGTVAALFGAWAKRFDAAYPADGD